MKILQDIIKNKLSEISDRKQLCPIKVLEKRRSFTAPTVPLEKYLTKDSLSGVIAEIKRSSPSAGVFHSKIDITKTSIGFMRSGASALSILTDNKFFSGSIDDLQTARDHNFCPILRKDFILDEYQILESKAYGADCILLIARILKWESLCALVKLSQSLGLSVLVEAHNKNEIIQISSLENVIFGINSRDLDTLEINHDLFAEAINLLPVESIKVAESGIQQPARIDHLRSIGYRGFLIGEKFMRASNPVDEIQEFISNLNRGE